MLDFSSSGLDLTKGMFSAVLNYIFKNAFKSEESTIEQIVWMFKWIWDQISVTLKHKNTTEERP